MLKHKWMGTLAFLERPAASLPPGLETTVRGRVTIKGAEGKE
jgi:hypothetical protein